MQLTNFSEIADILKTSKTIAVVGLSPKSERPSNDVARYLISAGYTVIPVNPGQSEILGRTCYPDLSSVPEAIDIVDIFRRPEHVLPIVEEAIKIKAKVVWMQEGVVHEEAAKKARAAGLKVIMDRCLKVDHANLLGP